jgi:beta-lactamase class A
VRWGTGLLGTGWKLSTATAVLLSLSVAGCVSAPDNPPPRRTAPRPIPPRPVAQPIPRPLPPRPITQPWNAQTPPEAMAQGIKALWAAYPDRAGVAVMRADGDWLIEHRGAELMPQQSVSKLWVGIAVMQAVDEGRLSLSDRVTVRDTDLTLFNQPIEEMIDDDGFDTTIGALLQAAMTMSDNTANDFLMRRVGGASAVRAMLSNKGLSAIRFGPGEIGLQSLTAGVTWRPEYRFKNNFEVARAKLSLEERKAAFDKYLADPIDGASPAGIARALIKLHRGELLSAESTRHLIGLMASSGTGKLRLRAGVPPSWQFAHKTGTGQNFSGRTAGYNDIGLMIAPDGTAYAVVVLIAETIRPIPNRQAFMQGISALIGANHSR